MSYRKYYEQNSAIGSSEERKRLCQADLVDTWRHWGPYLSERQWGTVREWYDPSDGKNPWTDLVHDHARSRAYRWGEDGIAGISDLQQLLCFSVALWNEQDPIIKERLFGLTNGEGNHGEDVKEYYYYLENTPTHSYMKYLYKYPYEYPYGDLVSKSHSIDPLEYELVNTGCLDNGRYFDLFVEYAKNTPEDILIRISVANRGNERRTLRVLPSLFFRNTWSWSNPPAPKPELSFAGTDPSTGACCIKASEVLSSNSSLLLSRRWLYCGKGCGEVLFTENETNLARFKWGDNASPYVKDGINDYIISLGRDSSVVNPARCGTKAAAHYSVTLQPEGQDGSQATIVLRLSDQQLTAPFSDEFDQIFARRLSEADQFYDALCPYSRTEGTPEQRDMYQVQRQAYAGMLWSKQLYHLVVHRWLAGDTVQPSYAHSHDDKMSPWPHFYSKDVMSMPDKWEYPWFAAWDLAFHTTTLAIIDPDFAKHQLELLLMEWNQHPNGQIPAYEWDFANINPPVHAWAAWRVYQTEKEIYGQADTLFLERVFNKLNMNFTWWVNKVDERGNNIFEGGFLGMDNIRILDRDPSGARIEQADGSAWMAMFCLNMLRIAIELNTQAEAKNGGATYQYKDGARKYLQHFMFICSAMNQLGDEGLWDDEEGFFMDCANKYGRLKVFSMVGLVPLFAIEQISQKVSAPTSFYEIYGFLRWFAMNRSDLVNDNDHINLDGLLDQVTSQEVPEVLSGTVAVVNQEKLVRILKRLLATDQFLSPHGIRGLSKYHLDNNYVSLPGSDKPLFIAYEPAESIKMLRMGGNSNWCGPVWMPVNYLIIDALRRYQRYLGSDFKVEYPTGSGTQKTLNEVADDLALRLVKIFLRDSQTGKRPVFGDVDLFQTDPHWKDYVLFYEYFHGGDRNDLYAGSGLGASHQTGWTGLVANLIQELGVRERARQLGIKEDSEVSP